MTKWCSSESRVAEEILVAEVAERAGHDRMGDFYRHWQPGAPGVSLIRELRFEIR